MTLCIDTAEVTSRWKRFKKTFGPITPNGRVEAFVTPTATQVVAGLGRDRYARELRQLRHPCRVPNIFINYFEIWQGHTQPQQFVLDKAYFHLDTPLGDGRASEEILAIHCDALAKGGEVAFSYKRGPHLHVSGKQEGYQQGAHRALSKRFRPHMLGYRCLLECVFRNRKNDWRRNLAATCKGVMIFWWQRVFRLCHGLSPSTSTPMPAR